MFRNILNLKVCQCRSHIVSWPSDTLSRRLWKLYFQGVLIFTYSIKLMTDMYQEVICGEGNFDNFQWYSKKYFNDTLVTWYFCKRYYVNLIVIKGRCTQICTKLKFTGSTLSVTLDNEFLWSFLHWRGKFLEKLKAHLKDINC